VKYRIIILVLCVFMIHCPKQHKPSIERIEVTYIGSLYEDIMSDTPLLAGIKDREGITLGHVMTQPPYKAVLLGKFGFFELLNETGIDHVIADPNLVNLDNVMYFIIPYHLGYVIQNYGGIRFAIMSKGKDSLSIQDQIQVGIVDQRSDIMWMIDPAFLMSKPMTHCFYVQNRGLADTSTTMFQPEIDTLLVKKLKECARNVAEILGRTVTLDTFSLKEFTLRTAARNQGADVMLYPSDLFKTEPDKHILTIDEFISAVACEQRFQTDDMTSDQIMALQDDHDLGLWGALSDTATVLYPAAQGRSLFDLLSLATIPTKY
jgi:hypothetical protein